MVAILSLFGSTPVAGRKFHHIQLFFSTPQLPAGLHSLYVVHHGTDKETPLTLDYLIVTHTSSVFNTLSPLSTPKSSDSHKAPIGA
jgi:hypothetical protein